MKRAIFFLSAILFHLFVQAQQTPVGKWKLTDAYTTDKNGNKTDLRKDFTKDHPCLPNVVFEFNANGKMLLLNKECPIEMQDYGMGSKWKSQKNQILIYIDEEDTDPAYYELTYGINKMFWKISYPDDSVIKLLVFEFTKA